MCFMVMEPRNVKRLSDKARLYEKLYQQLPYGREIEGTAELLLQIAEKLAVYEDMQGKIEKRIKEIKAVSYYPHNFTGQMVEDFEWVLNQIS